MDLAANADTGFDGKRLGQALARLPSMGGTTPTGVRFFGADLDDVKLQADDLDWTYGSGMPLLCLAAGE